MPMKLGTEVTRMNMLNTIKKKICNQVMRKKALMKKKMNTIKQLRLLQVSF